MRRLLVAIAVTCAGAGTASAQERVCTFATEGRSETSPNEPGIIVIHSPFTFTCDDGASLSANSGRIDQVTGVANFVGNVYFQDAANALNTQEATYDSRTGYLLAVGDVRFEDRLDGSTLVGPNLEYYRATESRPVARMAANQRPRLTLRPRSAGGTQDPIALVADRVDMVGQDDLSAFGSVVITRTDLNATSGEATYNSLTEVLEMRQNAIITSEGRELTGDEVLIRLVENEIEYLHARTRARLESEELRVTGHDLQLFFVADELQRAVAVGTTSGDSVVRATAASPTFELVADSLDADFVAQRLNEVHAIGDARGTSIDTAVVVPVVVAPTDSAALAGVSVDPVAAAFASDWVRGDTIIGYFAPAGANSASPDSLAVDPDLAVVVGGDDADTAVDLERIVAIGGAQSVYRIEGENDPPGERRNLNFLVGERIELEMADGELRVASVEGLQYGIYLEPNRLVPAPTPGVIEPAPDPDAAPDPIAPPPMPQVN